MKKKYPKTPGAEPVMGNPLTAAEQINKFGTYEIQPTADSDFAYPKIAQGLPEKRFRKKESPSHKS